MYRSRALRRVYAGAEMKTDATSSYGRVHPTSCMQQSISMSRQLTPASFFPKGTQRYNEAGSVSFLTLQREGLASVRTRQA